MIICRTPFRISFFGGGTDFPAWYRQHGGSVLSTTIDKHCYLTCRYFPPFFEHRVRVVWSQIENCTDIAEVKHPVVRALVEQMGIDRCLEIHHQGDLPARSGMGSSSAFTVGLLNALHALQGRILTKKQLAMGAISFEQDVLQEAVGSQDQVCAAYGGFNQITFLQNGEMFVRPITVSQARIRELESHLMLFFTGIQRTSSDVMREFAGNIQAKEKQLVALGGLVDKAIALLNSDVDICGFGELLSKSWDIKVKLHSASSSQELDALMETAYSAGALGGKLTGAGGGGFLLLFVPPSEQPKVREALRDLLYVPFQFEYAGSQIIFAEEDSDYSREEEARRGQQITPFREFTPGRDDS